MWRYNFDIDELPPALVIGVIDVRPALVCVLASVLLGQHSGGKDFLEEFGQEIAYTVVPGAYTAPLFAQ